MSLNDPSPVVSSYTAAVQCYVLAFCCAQFDHHSISMLIQNIETSLPDMYDPKRKRQRIEKACIPLREIF